jgi:hypothetical protein
MGLWKSWKWALGAGSRGKILSGPRAERRGVSVEKILTHDHSGWGIVRLAEARLACPLEEHPESAV